MRILQIYRIDKDDLANTGVINKQLAQAKALRMEHETDIINLGRKGVYKNGTLLFPHEKEVKSKFQKFVFYHFRFYQTLRYLLNPSEYDLIYIRFHAMHSSFYTFIQEAKTSSNNIIIEVPTFPYEEEYKGFWQKLRLKLDRPYRTKLTGLVSRIVHFGPHETIFDIPTIRLTNGIDTDMEYTVARLNETDILRIVAVGKWQDWHGIDRLLNGIHQYKGNQKIEFHIVGEGPATKSYKAFVGRHDLDTQVKFHGKRVGAELDDLMDKADIAVGSLADHRKSLRESSPLKNREYCMRGIPFILSTPDLDFPETLSFVKYFPTDDSNIPIEDLIDFKRSREKDVQQQMLAYARENIGWKKKMKFILNEM